MSGQNTTWVRRKTAPHPRLTRVRSWCRRAAELPRSRGSWLALERATAAVEHALQPWNRTSAPTSTNLATAHLLRERSPVRGCSRLSPWEPRFQLRTRVTSVLARRLLAPNTHARAKREAFSCDRRCR